MLRNVVVYITSIEWVGVDVDINLLCVCVLSSHLFWTSDVWTHQPGSHRRKVAQDFSTFFRCLPKLFSREGFSRSFPSSTVKSNFVYTHELTVLRLLGMIYLFFEENFSSFDCTEIRTHVPTSESFEVTN